ncbi:MAG: hypothetical protein KY475_23870, partial [Planctomycetes bacterium]|nr:hypothetical protein [Planctomycetota bacterium]
HRPAIVFFEAFGFRGDVMRVFFPLTLAFVVWVALRIAAFAVRGFYLRLEAMNGDQRQRLERASLILYRISTGLRTGSRWLCAAMVVLLAMAITALLVTGDISFSFIANEWGVKVEQDTVRAVQRMFLVVIAAVVVVGLLPYIRLDRLIHSGATPKNAVESWIFNAALLSLLCGVPLLLFAGAVQEDLSNYNGERPDRHQLNITSFGDWQAFWNRVEREAKSAENSTGPASAPMSAELWKAVSQATGPYEPNVHRVSRRDAYIKRLDQDVYWFRRWWDGARYSWEVIGGDAPVPSKHRDDVDAKLAAMVEELEKPIDEEERLTRWRLNFGKDENLFLLLWHARRLQDEEKELLLKELNKRWLDPEAEEFSKAPDSYKVAGEGALPGGEDPKLHSLHRQAAACAALLAEANDEAEPDPRRRKYLARELAGLNRKLLQAGYGDDLLRPGSTVFAYNVIKADQARRWEWLAWLVLLFGVAALTVHLNATSMHGFYRDQLTRAWIVEHPTGSPTLPLSELDTCSRGAPYVLINGALNLFDRRSDREGGPTDAFLFSQLFVGAESTGYARTKEYYHGRYDLANAIAISGAAVSPVSVRNYFLRVLLLLTNSRLGQWLPNPHAPRRAFAIRRLMGFYPSPLRLMLAWMCCKPRDRALSFISDGGIHDNLGIESLLQRRCRVIVAVDAGADPAGHFTDLLKLVRRMRVHHGVRLCGVSEHDELLPLEGLLAGEDDTHAKVHFLCAAIHYPPDPRLGPEGDVEQGYLVYVKPSFTGDEAADLQRYRLENQVFPHDPTLDQFYDPRRFEAYRGLGHHIGLKICEYLDRGGRITGRPPEPTLASWTPPPSRGPARTEGAVPAMSAETETEQPEPMTLAHVLAKEAHAGRAKEQASDGDDVRPHRPR